MIPGLALACGHDALCTKFKNPIPLQLASKLKSFPFVGSSHAAIWYAWLMSKDFDQNPRFINPPWMVMRPRKSVWKRLPLHRDLVKLYSGPSLVVSGSCIVIRDSKKLVKCMVSSA